MYRLILFTCIFINLCPGKANSETTDLQWLLYFIEQNEIQPIRNEPLLLDPQYYLGQALFFDKLLSTNKDTACSTCHLVNNHTSDSLPTAIGVGGRRLGALRTPGNGTKPQDRNTQSLFNLDNNEVKNLFWDGRVEVDLKGPIRFSTPFANHIPIGLENALAAQSLIPIITDSEMRSSICALDGEEQEYCSKLYQNFENVDESIWSLAYLSFIRHRLLGHSGKQDISPMQRRYRELFKLAYPESSKFSISDIANALARYQEIAFASRKTPWDSFLKGETTISKSQAKGARLFFEKFKCNNCHSNTLFSDFDFHSIGVVSLRHGEKLDKGRFEVTKNEADILKFRTPSLRNVTLTGPYMHDGSMNNLEEAIYKHFTGCLQDATHYEICKRSAFQYAEMIQHHEIQSLMEFMKFLEDKSHTEYEYIIPAQVPSGLRIDELIE